MAFIDKFDNDHYMVTHYTKRQIFDRSVWQLIHKLKENNIPGDIEFSEQRLKDITKNTKKLINDLLTDNKIIPLGNNRYKINYQKVYCKYCYKKLYEDSKTEYNRDFYSQDPRFYIYVWETRSHLKNFHYMDRDPYEFSEDKSIRNPITPEVIKEYISNTEPKYEIKEHNFKVVNIDTSYKFDRVEIELKCVNCDYKTTIRQDIETCIKEVTK